MRPTLAICLTLLTCTPGIGHARWLKHSPCDPKSKLPGCTRMFHDTKLRPYTPTQRVDHGLADKVSPQGKRVRGFYLTPYYLFKLGAARVAAVMKRNHMNTVVIDVKDDLGRVLWPSNVALSRGLQKHLIADPAKTIKELHAHGIYVIARLVCFKDSRLPYKRPDLGVRIGPKARRLFSAGANWVDAYSPEVRDYLIDLSVELQGHGFDEIQLDYIRFPKGRTPKYATWLHRAKGSPDRSTQIRTFLEQMDRALQLPLSVDVYGLTTLVDGDPRRLGQTIEVMARYAEAISPMMYPNGMGSYFKGRKVMPPQVYRIIHCGLWRARRKLPGILLRPYLQAYPNNVEHFFGPDFIKQQVVAARRAGSNGFLFWNSTMRNRVAFIGLRRLGTKALLEFGSKPQQHKAAKNTPGRWCKRRGDVYVMPKKRKRRPASKLQAAVP
jgi:hypothetical protein